MYYTYYQNNKTNAWNVPPPCLLPCFIWLYILFLLLSENEIDVDALKLINDNDLLQLIPKVGPRTKFRKALDLWRQVEDPKIIEIQATGDNIVSTYLPILKNIIFKLSKIFSNLVSSFVKKNNTNIYTYDSEFHQQYKE